MKKYTKEIASLLTLVTAGIIGGSVYAADAPDTPTAGVPILSRTEDTETPEASEYMPVTSYSDKYCEGTTDCTVVMGLMMPPDTTPSESTVTTPPDTTTVTISTTPFMGTFVYDTTTTKPPVIPGSTVPVTAPPKIIPVRGGGDIDGSGVTDLSDLIKLSMYLLGDIDLDDSQLIQADITKDGKVNITDLPALRMRIMTPEKSTPVPGTTTTLTTIPDTTTTVTTAPDITTVPEISPETPVTDDSYARIWLSHEPDKTEYKIGEELDLSGAVIEGCGHSPQGPNWDIFSHPVTFDDTLVKVDASSFNNQVPGSYTIIISHNHISSCSTSFTVTVTE